MVAFAIVAALAAAASPATADLGFMVGRWQLEGRFNPGAADERIERGSQACGSVMGGAYIRCDRTMTAGDGKSRELVTFHNYNRLYRRFEHLFIASSWPTKVIGSSGLDRNDDAAEMTIDISFALPDGRTEHVRSVDRYRGDRFESLEQIRVGDGEWRTNYRLTGTRVE